MDLQLTAKPANQQRDRRRPLAGGVAFGAPAHRYVRPGP